MNCIETIIGLRGGCADISSVGDVWLDDKVTYKELEAIIDQKDHASVDDMFTRWRSQAVREIVDSINESFADRYIHRTVISAKQIGTTADRLTSISAEAKIKGFRFYQCNEWPSIAYRVTRLGFIGQFTGNLPITYWDGITGQQLATDTLAVTAGQWSWLDLNRVFRGVRILLIGYNATAVASYSTQVCPNLCYTCPNSRRVNNHVDGYGFTADIGNVVGSLRTTNEASGLSVVMGMECDAEGWLCAYRQQMALPMLWKVAQLAMEYAIFNSDRNNTKMTRDAELLTKRQMMYREEYEASMKRMLKSIVVPNDPVCFKCNRRSRIVAAIP